MFIKLITLFFFSMTLVAEPNNTTDRPEPDLHLKKTFKNPVEDPKLPRVLLIGDSISIGYTIPVRKLLNDKVNVHRIPTNGRYAAYGLKNIDKWISDKQWDVIHFNWGLWDLCYRNPQSTAPNKRDKVNGKITATPAEYRKNMEALVTRLKKTGAKLIWCETTPVPEGEPGRKAGDAIKYNAIANEIMLRNDIQINYLHAHALKRLPEISSGPGDVHYNKKGSAYLAKKVAEEIKLALAQ